MSADTDFDPAQPEQSVADSEPTAAPVVPENPDRMLYRGLLLDRFQTEAIRHIQANRSVLVAAPTGTGKTIIADYVVEQALAQGNEVIYTAPIKALSNQKYRDYTRLYGKDAIGLVTGDLVINPSAPIRIMTTEILRNILLQDSEPPQLSHVIVDEAHFLDDEERGTVWEELLIYLPPAIRIVALSATLPNIDEFAEWLRFVRNNEVAVVKESQRAVPLKLMLANHLVGVKDPRSFDADFRQYRQQQEDDRGRDDRGRDPRDRDGRGSFGGGRFGRPDDRRPDPRHSRRPEPGRDAQRGPVGRDGRSADRGGRPGRERFPTTHLDLIQFVTPDYLPVLYFVFSRRQTELFARELGRKSRRPFLNRMEHGQVSEALDAFDAQNKDVLTPEHRSLYLNGIAFHHAGLHVSLKALVEELYERKLIKVLYCTSTFALGINLPARTVLFDSLRKFNGTTMAPLTVRQFQQKAGRAGRRGMDKVGYVIVREDFSDYPDDRPLLQSYQEGRYERLRSAFNLSFSSVINLLHRYARDEIRRILDKSFLNFTHYKQLEADREKLTLQLQTATRPADQGRYGKDSAKRIRKQLNKVERALDGDEGLLYKRFEEKENFLKSAGYLDDDGSFAAGAKALMAIQISEIFVTELLLEGVFEEVSDDELFGVLTGLVQELPRSVTIREPVRGKWAKLRDRLRRIRDSETVTRGTELMGFPVPFCPELMPFGEKWAEGTSLNALLLLVQSDIDISGDLVGAFRRAKDLATQLKAAYKEDDLMVERLNRILKKVSRDEVEVLD